MNRRTLLSASGVWLLAAAAPSHSAEVSARSYAIVSLVGDKINIVSRRMATGSRIDQNLREGLALNDRSLDRDALLAADEALERSSPGVKISLLAVSTPSLYENQSQLFEGDKVLLPAEVMKQITSVGASHLVLITKYRYEARLQLRDGAVGSGFLEGLGFYIDRTQQVIDSETRESGKGFLAPFVYVQLRLIDLATATVLRTKSVIASSTFAASGSATSSDPWDALSSAEKVDTLRRMLSHEVEHAIPNLVAGL
jgi:hypothetical protein